MGLPVERGKVVPRRVVEAVQVATAVQLVDRNRRPAKDVLPALDHFGRVRQVVAGLWVSGAWV